MDAVQGALVQEVAERRPALKRSAWTPSMTVHYAHFKHCLLVRCAAERQCAAAVSESATEMVATRPIPKVLLTILLTTLQLRR